MGLSEAFGVEYYRRFEMKKKITTGIFILALAIGYSAWPPIEKAMSQPPEDPNMVATVSHVSLTARAMSERVVITIDGVVVRTATVSETYTPSTGLSVEIGDALVRKMQIIIDEEKLVYEQSQRPVYINAPAWIESQLNTEMIL